MGRTLEADQPSRSENKAELWSICHIPKWIQIQNLTGQLKRHITQIIIIVIIIIPQSWYMFIYRLQQNSTVSFYNVSWITRHNGVNDSYVGCRRALRWWGSSNSRRRRCTCLGVLKSTCPLSEHMAEQHIWSSVLRSHPKDTWQWTCYIWKSKTVEEIWVRLCSGHWLHY